MFAINSELYPSPRNPCRHKSVWPRRRTEAEESSSLTRSAMVIEPHGTANCATASQPSQNNPQVSLLGPCHRRLENGDTSSLLSRVRTRFVHSIFHRTPCPTQRQAKNAKSILIKKSQPLLIFSRQRKTFPIFLSDRATSAGALPQPVRHRLTRPLTGDYRRIGLE